MAAVVAGKPNKAIARELDMGLRTVELRRANVMRIMGVRCVAELVRLELIARESPEPNPHTDVAPDPTADCPEHLLDRAS